MEVAIIAKIHTDFPEKFGIPRQSGLVPGSMGRIVFEPTYRNPDALRGIEGFSHLWLLWGFHKAFRNNWSATVKPPRLGGQTKMGVFATRSPFRPNPIGLSSVKLEAVEEDPVLGMTLLVSGVDMLDGTPIYDIKPYLPYADCHPQAVSGFVDQVDRPKLHVTFPEELLELLPEKYRQSAMDVLAQDPRTAFIHDDDRIWGVAYAGFNLRFTVKGLELTVVDVRKI